MSARDYDQAVVLMRQRRDLMEFVGAREESLVGAAEAALGLTFPPPYRRFLLEYGAGAFGAKEFHGVVGERFEGPFDVVATTIRDRAYDLPPSFVVVYGLGNGEFFCLDTGQVGAPAVTNWPGAGAEQEREELAEDFGALLLMLVRWELEALADDARYDSG